MPGPAVPPLEDPTTVKNIVKTLKELTTERLDIEKKVVEFQNLIQDSDIGKFVRDHGSNFSILPNIIIVEPNTIWTKTIRLSRDTASGAIAGRITDFVAIKIVTVEKIDTMEKCQHARKSLAAFAKEEDPLVSKPLKGVDAVSKIFSEVWSAVSAESQVIADALDKATAENLPEIIKKLTGELKPVKQACSDIKTEVLNYATAVTP